MGRAYAPTLTTYAVVGYPAVRWRRTVRTVSDDGLFLPPSFQDSPPPSLLQAAPDHVAYDDTHSGRNDPLQYGFLLFGGLLATLPPRVRLPHEDDEGEEVLV